MVAMVEVLDPMVLGSRVCPVQVCEPCSLTIPTDVQAVFGDDLVLGGDKQRLFVTLGQFSIIRLERPAQLIVPVLDWFLTKFYRPLETQDREARKNILYCGKKECPISNCPLRCAK